jgi:predicted metal-dependent hydrolase
MALQRFGAGFGTTGRKVIRRTSINHESLTDPALKRHVVIKRSKRAKRLALRLDSHKGVFNLVIPPHVSLKKAAEFAKMHKEWIKECIEELPEAIPFEDGTWIPIFGRRRLIVINYDPDLHRTMVVLKSRELEVNTNLEDPTPKIIAFLRKIAVAKLNEMAREKASQIDEKIKSVRVKDTKSRWGSCSEDSDICFSWRLIFAPDAAVDYVVAHEVAHLAYLDHSKKFWAMCRGLSKNYMEGYYWMHNHGAELMRYGA